MQFSADVLSLHPHSQQSFSNCLYITVRHEDRGDMRSCNVCNYVCILEYALYVCILEYALYVCILEYALYVCTLEYALYVTMCVY